MSFDATRHPHRRRNLLTNEWVLVSPQRADQRWEGDVAPPDAVRGAAYDPGFYLCPGNLRTGGDRNPGNCCTFAFSNDFPAVPSAAPAPPRGPSPVDMMAGMTGDGFGSAVVAVMPRGETARVRQLVLERYRTPAGAPPDVMVERIASGVGLVETDTDVEGTTL